MIAPIKRRSTYFLIAILVILFSLFLSWASTGFQSLQGVWSFFGMTIVGCAILFLGWLGIKSEKIPGWVGWLMAATMVLRILVGTTWSIVLPQLGHGTEAEAAGYVMSDAHRRDTTAWELAQSGKPLHSAFSDYRLADQYGGLLFISALTYRIIGGDTHQPLLMVMLTSSFSALSILFLWAFTKRLWGDSAAKTAVWILFLYPEGVLLGSSQMREAFMMSLAGISLYGLVLYWQERKRTGIVWVAGVLIVSLPISTLFAVTLLGVLVALAFVLDKGRIFQNWKLWLLFGCLLIIGLSAVWILGDRIYPEGASNPLELISQWLVHAARWEKRTAAISSGWFEKILNRSPEWAHFWLILGYGTVQPFLPAAIIATGNWTWRIIAIWRAVGWTFMLVLLLYAPIRAARRIRKEHIAFGISLIVWLVVLVAAYRGGGDQWDNPRYRVSFIILQASLAGWVWVKQRHNPDPWFKRILIGLGLVFAWFIPWYLRRYSDNFTWHVIDLFKTLGLGIVTAVLYFVYDWLRKYNNNGAKT